MKQYPLIDDCISSLGLQSAQSHFDENLTNISKTISGSDMEKDFLSVIPIALASGNINVAVGLINIVNSQSLSKQAATSLSAYSLYVNKLSHSKGLRKRVLNLCKNSNLQIFTQSNLKTIFERRINTQSRLSGNKVWLPLYFIQLLCNAHGQNLHLQYKHDIYNRLNVVINNNGHFVHIPVSSIDVLGICHSGNVYCAIGNIIKNVPSGIYQVFTPTGYLNRKDKMYAIGIQDIDIDHVTPIDYTLKQLNLPYLSKISTFVQTTKAKSKSLCGKNLEKAAFASYKTSSSFPFNNAFFAGLQNDLTSIINNSYYRLVDKINNSKKSNVVDYKSFCCVNGKYYAIIDDTNVFDASNNPMVLFQDLSLNNMTITSPTLCGSILNAKKIKQVQVPIDLL